MKAESTEHLTPFERGVKAAPKGLEIYANPYANSRDYHAGFWWRGWRSVTGEAELPPIVIAGYDDRITRVDPIADADDEDRFDDVAAISTILSTAA